jgi:hypothetical protein
VVEVGGDGTRPEQADVARPSEDLEQLLPLGHDQTGWITT